MKRKVSLKILDYGKVEEASGGRCARRPPSQAGISSDKARELNKFIKGLGLKGIQSQTQGESLRVTGKKRDDLQGVIARSRPRTSACRSSSTTSATSEEAPPPERARALPQQVVGGRDPRRPGSVGNVRCSTRAPEVQSCHSPERRRRMRSSIGGWVAVNFASCDRCPANGLTM